VAQLYSNENFPRPVVVELRRLGHDVLTVLEAGNANLAIPDDQVLAFAIGQKRACLTLNRQDFIRLHRQRPDHFGVVVCSWDPDFVALASRIHLTLCANRLVHWPAEPRWK
jgi:hypothetical protein